MTWVDFAILAVLAISAILAFLRGFVHEVLGIAAWAGAAAAAFFARPTVTPFLEPHIDPPWLADAIGAGIVFLVVLIVLKIIVGAIARRVQDSVLGGPDRVFGLLFGLARGAIVVVAAYIGAGLLLPPERWPDPVRQARALPIVADVANRLVGFVPPEYQPRVVAPPAPTMPPMDDLLRPPARDRT